MLFTDHLEKLYKQGIGCVMFAKIACTSESWAHIIFATTFMPTRRWRWTIKLMFIFIQNENLMFEDISHSMSRVWGMCASKFCCLWRHRTSNSDKVFPRKNSFIKKQQSMAFDMFWHLLMFHYDTTPFYFWFLLVDSHRTGTAMVTKNLLKSALSGGKNNSINNRWATRHDWLHPVLFSPAFP